MKSRAVRIVIAVVGAVTLLAAAPKGTRRKLELVSAAEKSAASAITQDVIRAHTRFLASDLLGGRAPASEGDRLSQEYLATEMQALGLKPAAPEGGYIQKVPLVGITGKAPDSLAIAGTGKSLDLKYRDDFIAFSGVLRPQVSIENAEVVFVGYGIVAPEYDWNDYKDADLKGKVLLVMNNDPEDDPKLFAGKTRLWYGRWDYKYMMPRSKVPSARSSSTPTTRRATRGRSCRARGPASGSSSPTKASHASRSRPGRPRTPAGKSLRSAARISTDSAPPRKSVTFAPFLSGSGFRCL